MQLTHEENQFERKTFPITLVCDHIYFQQNIGSLFRISEAFGVENIIFFGKDIPLTPRKINKTSRSTHLHVPHSVIEDFTDLQSFLIDNDFEIIALEIALTSKPLKEVVIPENKKIALLIGSEINGISDELLKLSHQIVHINMFGKNSSMNVVQAASIALYELTCK
ncbi:MULTISPECIES: TrmH family RNA methyltransferase [unclassified Flavobacterium]|jgi:tRNA G18 (ribose-2'-O)-methylase SpoU|uniref:TrmH family RNA methyltransferase n=1 Tax=unclassified Flavobacterium TaxID=196869 RepID=UPI002490DE1A|nr:MULTISPECIES: TrmH family RNA methyltransferase [unclassified Flavobacterium]MDQ1166706.1 tRNA G18 (ribose-2'-O)-methylase SpoU [Flavobacterium sp. SORGH_AS_0622]BDU27178.1 RNA methyltransferase [Flavobacterium sp. GSB-24]